MAIQLLILLFSHHLHAAACCSGGSSQIAIITGDLASQFKVGYANTAVIADVDSQRQINDRDSSLREVTETFDLQYNRKISDVWQMGLSIPVVQKTKQTKTQQEESRGIGDLSLQTTYEFLPELEYSEWKPKGFLFSYVKLPNAPSIYDSSEPLQSDSYGKGFYQFGLGALFVKRLKGFEVLASPTLIYYLPKAYNLDFQSREIQPGISSFVRYGATYFFKQLPMQVSLQHVIRHDEKTKVEGLSDSSNSYYQDMILNLSYDWKIYSFSGFYSNQKILGPAKNTSLESSIGVQITSSYDL
jgi:hypothetical protein